MPAFKVIAHRGASAYAVDNTIAAFEKAIIQGAPLIETDVQITTDGVLVLEHDSLVAGQFVAAMTHAQLAAVRPGLLTLNAALHEFGPRIPFCWEVKTPGIEAALVSAVRDSVPADVWRATEFTSFFPASAIACQRAAPTNNVGWLTRGHSENAIDAVAAAGLKQVCPPAIAILENPALVDYAKAKGIMVRVWQVSEASWLPELVQAGVYGGTVNWPDKAFEVLNR